MEETLPARVRFGGFELELKTGELRGGEQTSRLTEKPFRVLLILVEHSGQLVTREEMQKKLWPNDTIVDFEHGINAAIKTLRRALGDSADEPKYIETFARRGYRLMVPVEWIEDSPTLSPKPGDKGGAPVQIESGGLIGKKVSHYRVLEIIGGGGMGLVYKAEDLKLGRHVAVKFLPEELASDPVALQRFEREARTASSLNHPNICTIHEVEEYGGQPFIVMELLEGQTLRDRLASSESKTVPVDELLGVATQICDGLEAAHQKGIIHRDIKPANIFLTAQGQVKILDFGLAKLVVEAPGFSPAKEEEEEKAGLQPLPGLKPDSLEEPARRAEARLFHQPATPAEATLSRTGVAMGTTGYMSPEQVLGEKLDARTDLFSFGLVLYEMGTGQRAFSGETAAVVHDAILNKSPVPVRDLNTSLPPRLEQVINKALEKDREQRYPSAAEMGDDLRAQQKHQAREAPRPKTRRVVAIALAAVVLCGAGWMLLRSKLRPPQPTKEPIVKQLTSNPPDNPVMNAAISPDGKRLAYSDRANGVSILQIDSGETRTLPNTRSFVAGGWLDEDHVSVYKQGGESGVWKLSTIDGSLRKLRDDSMPLAPSPDGKRLLGLKGNEIWLMGAEGEDAHRVLATASSSTIFDLAWSPSGQRFLYEKFNAPGIYASQTQRGALTASLDTCDLEGQCFTVLSDGRLRLKMGASPIAWLADGRIVFGFSESAASGGDTNLWSLQVDPNSGRVLGEAKRLTNWTTFSPYSMSRSRDGKRLAFANFRTQATAKVAELQKGGKLGTPRRLSSDTWFSSAAGWTADSQAVLFTAARYGKDGIFTQPLNGGTPLPLVVGPESYDAPVITPDGKFLLYTAEMEGGSVKLMRMPLQGGPATLVMSGSYIYRCASLPASLCVMSEARGNQLAFSSLDLFTGRGPQLATLALPAMYYWTLSPDGKNIALVDLGASGDEVRVLSTEGGGERVVHVKGWDLLQTVHWAADGKHLYVSGGYGVSGDQDWGIVLVDLTGQFKVLLKVAGNRDWVFGPVPSPDGRHLAYSEQAWESNIVMLENF